MAELFSLFGRILPPLLLIVVALLALRRWSRHVSPSDPALRVVARTGLTRSSVVAIVAVGSRRFLLGASEAGVRLLQELEPVSDPGRLVTGGTEPIVARPGTGVVGWLRARTVRVTGEGPGHVARR